MAKNFRELEVKMSPESRARVAARVKETLRDLDRAFQNFFEGRARFPRGMGVDLAAPVLPLGVGNATKSLRARRGATEGAGEQVGPSYSLAKI